MSTFSDIARGITLVAELQVMVGDLVAVPCLYNALSQGEFREAAVATGAIILLNGVLALHELRLKRLGNQIEP